MNYKNVQIAIKEAERFIQRAKEIKPLIFEGYQRDDLPLNASKETAACKRASLDLTRALADMRQR